MCGGHHHGYHSGSDMEEADLGSVSGRTLGIARAQKPRTSGFKFQLCYLLAYKVLMFVYLSFLSSSVGV